MARAERMPGACRGGSWNGCRYRRGALAKAKNDVPLWKNLPADAGLCRLIRHGRWMFARVFRFLRYAVTVRRAADGEADFSV